MKRFVSIILAASMMLAAQSSFAQVIVGGGYLNSTLNTEGSNPSNANGAYAGASFNLPVAEGLSVAPGIYWSMLTSKDVSSLGNWITTTGTFTEHALNVPVLLNYGVNFGANSKFFVFAGPTAQYGLSSTVRTDVTSVIGDGTNTINNYEDGNFNRFNVYVGGGLGASLSKLTLYVGYDYGLLNQYTGTDAAKAHRSNLKVGVGFNF